MYLVFFVIELFYHKVRLKTRIIYVKIEKRGGGIMEKFRWAYIGSGGIAHSTAREITKGNHEIVSVYSRNKEKAEVFARKYGAKAYGSFEEAVCREDVDGVYIATPHTSHLEYSLRTMKAGKPVLCEKPVGVSFSEVQQMTDTAKQTDTYFCEAMWTWFSDVALTVKKWVKEGRIGEIRDVTINYSFPGIFMPKTSRVLTPETAGGALLDVGIYPITYCYNLFGVPEKIECKGIIRKGIDIGERVILHYKGFKCKLNISLLYVKENCTIKGTEGKITLPVFFHMASKTMLKSNEGNETYKGKTDYITQFDAVAKEIKGCRKESAFIPFDATAECMKIMDECRKQMGLVYPFERK